MFRLILISRVVALSLAVVFMAKLGFATTSSASAFIYGSLSEILSLREGKPLMVVLWSINLTINGGNLGVTLFTS